MIRSTLLIWCQTSLDRKMKKLLIFTLMKFVVGEKLDRIYLPPPGANLSGGDFNQNDLPFDLPKEYQPPDTESKPSLAIKPGKDYYNEDVYGSTPSYYDVYYNTPSTTTYLQSTFNPNTVDDPSTPPEYVIAKESESGLRENINLPDFVNNQFQNEPTQNSFDGKPFNSYNEINNVHPNSIPTIQNEKYYTDNPTYKDGTTTPIHNFVSGSEDSNDSNSVPNSFNIIENTNSEVMTETPNTPQRIQSEFDKKAQTTNQRNVLTPEGFFYDFDTTNGMHSDVSGISQGGVKAKGSFSYVGDDGKLYMMEYTADENGFQPRGNHLPTAPPIPKEIQMVIDQAYKDKAAGIFDDGSYNEDKYGYKNYMPKDERKIVKQYKNKDNLMDSYKNPTPNRIMIGQGTIYEPGNSNNYLTNNPQGNIEITGGIIPVKVIYDGYDYSPPQNKLNIEEFPSVGLSKKVNNGFQTTTAPENTIEEFVKEKNSRIDMGMPQNEYEKETFITQRPLENNKYATTYPDMSSKYSTSPDQRTIGYERYKTTSMDFPSTQNTEFAKFDDVSIPIRTSTDTFSTVTSSYPKDDIFSNKQNLEKSVGNREIPKTFSTPYKDTSSIKKGEDFSGPKQQQKYDPSYGYYY